MNLDLISLATPPITVQKVDYGYVLKDSNGHFAEDLTRHHRIKHYRSEERANEAAAKANQILGWRK